MGRIAREEFSDDLRAAIGDPPREKRVADLAELEREADVAALNYMKATEAVFQLKEELLAKAGELDAAEARATMLDRQFVATKIAYLEAKTAEGR